MILSSISKTIVMSALIFALILRILSCMFGISRPFDPKPKPTEPSTTSAAATTETTTAPSATTTTTVPSTTTTTTVPSTTTTTTVPTTTTTTTVPTTTTTTTVPSTTTTTAVPSTATTTAVPSTTAIPTAPRIPSVLSASRSYIKTFGGEGEDVFRGIEALPSGGFVVCGTSTSTTGDFEGKTEANWFNPPWSFVSKISENGDVLWTKTFGDPKSAVMLEDVTVLPDGNFAAVGYTDGAKYSSHRSDPADPGSDFSIDAIIVKIAPDGNNLGVKSFGGKNSDLFFCVEATSDGLVIGGKSDSTDGDFDGASSKGAVLLRLGTDNSVKWNRRVCGSKSGSFTDVDVGKNDEIFACCLTASSDGDFAAFKGIGKGFVDSVILKYDASGDYLWNCVIASSGKDDFSSVVADKNGGCVVAGYYTMPVAKPDGSLSGVHNCGGVDSLVVKINSSGKITRAQTVAGINDDYITDIVKSDSGFVVTGYSSSANRDFAEAGNRGGFDGFAGLIDKNCSSVKILSQGGSGDDFAECAAAVSPDVVLILGKTASSDGDFAGTEPRETLLGSLTKYKIASK